MQTNIVHNTHNLISFFWATLSFVFT